jgi:hypothetical protein
MRSGSHVQLAALRNRRDLELQTTSPFSNHGSVERQVVLVQFLSIKIFLLDFYNFCWVFQKFPFFCVTLYNQQVATLHNVFIWLYLKKHLRRMDPWMLKSNENNTPGSINWQGAY